MKNNEYIDILISNVTMEINDICKDKKIPQKIVKYLKIITIGLVLNYGDNIKNDIIDMYDDINFIIGKKNILEYIKSNEINSNIINKKPSTILDINYNNKSSFIYNICIGDYYLEYKTFIFEFLTSQLNRILCNKNKTILESNGNRIYRNGIVKYTNNSKNKSVTLNEVINGLQVESIIKNILKLREYDIKDKDIRDLLNHFTNTKYNGYVCSEYINEITLFRRLYENKGVKSLIDDSLLKGNIDNIKDDIDFYLGVNSYNGMCDLLNQLSNEIQINPYVNNEYDISSIYCELRDLLKNYMDKKYNNS